LRPTRLYHWTGAEGLEGIRAHRAIRATWPTDTSEAIPARVVWLTSREDTDQGWSVNRGLCAYVIVDLPDFEVVPWSAYRCELPVGTAHGLETSARFHGNGDPATWFGIRRDVAEAEWIDIVDLRQ
jgi:hypothetical protein